MSHVHYDAEAIRARLDYPGCIAAVAGAMRDFSMGGRAQPLRQICELGPARLLGLMPGFLADGSGFGAKVLSVFGDPAAPGRSSHLGLVLLFEPERGALLATGDAAEITHIRTAAASAVATAALARADARTLALFGCGAQALSHARALIAVREFERIVVWGRRAETAAPFAARLAAELAIPAVFEPDAQAAAQADVICTVTGASEPVLEGAWLPAGWHVNIVGSGVAGPVEVDHEVLLRGRYIVDSRASVLAAGAEFLRARAAGLVDDSCIAGEIGEVLGGAVAGRRDEGEITLYKSLGHIVQDLAALAYVHAQSGG